MSYRTGISAPHSSRRAWIRFWDYWFKEPDAQTDPFGRPCRMARAVFPILVYLLGFSAAAVRRLPVLVLAATLGWLAFSIVRRGGVAAQDAIVLIVGLCLLELARLLVNPRPLALQVTVPSSISAVGYSGEAIANRLLDGPREWLARPRAVPFTLAPPEALPKIEVPGVKLPLDSLADLVRATIGRRTRIVTGEVLEDSDGRLELRLRDASGGRVISVPARPRAEIATLIDDASEPLLLQVAPYALACARERLGKLSPALDAARQAASDQSVGARDRARAYVFCWRLCVSMDRPLGQQRDCLARALAESKFDAVVLSIVARHVAYDETFSAEQRRYWIALGVAAGFWSYSQTDTPDWQVRYLHARGESWCAARDQAVRCVGYGRTSLLYACQSLRALMDASLAPLTTLERLARLSDRYDENIASVEQQLDSSAQADPDGSAANRRNHLLAWMKRVKRIRGQWPNDRIEQALVWRSDAERHLRSIGQIAKQMRRDREDLESHRTQAVTDAVVSVRTLLDLCSALRCASPSRDAPDVRLWMSAALHLKGAEAAIDEASKRMSRLSPRRRAQVGWSARSLSRLGRWLTARTPSGEEIEASAARDVRLRRRLDGSRMPSGTDKSVG